MPAKCAALPCRRKILDHHSFLFLITMVSLLNWKQNTKKVEYQFVTLSDVAYPFNNAERSSTFTQIKGFDMVFVKIGYKAPGELTAAGGYLEHTLTFSNYNDRHIDTEGFCIYTSPTWNVMGAVSVNFETGEIKYIVKSIVGWTVSDFLIKRVYGFKRP